MQVVHRVTGAVLWEGADLAGADLRGANLDEADLAGANLGGANLAGAYLGGANLAGANLAGADLRRADLAGADLRRADLAGADLAGANLVGANLVGANLAGAYLGRADLCGATIVDGGQRSDGYRFTGHSHGGLRVTAGCRYLLIEEARQHWLTTRGGTPLGDETMAILDHIERVAKIRGIL